MDAARLKEAAKRHGPAMLAGLLLGALLMLLFRASGAAPPAPADPRRVADAALVSVREQGRLDSLVARYVAVVSSAETSLGMEARKTLILPASVRYGVDLRRLRREHLAWDEATGTLSITLPPLEISAPEIDMVAARESSEGGVMMALTGAEAELDAANLRLAQAELQEQARGAAPVATAQDVALRTVARAFALPMRAAGIEASVSVRFVDSDGRDLAVHLDRHPRVEDVVKDRQAGERPSPEGNGQ
jgi:hypothetical protein